MRNCDKHTKDYMKLKSGIKHTPARKFFREDGQEMTVADVLHMLRYVMTPFEIAEIRVSYEIGEFRVQKVAWSHFMTWMHLLGEVTQTPDECSVRLYDDEIERLVAFNVAYEAKDCETLRKYDFHYFRHFFTGSQFRCICDEMRRVLRQESGKCDDVAITFGDILARYFEVPKWSGCGKAAQIVLCRIAEFFGDSDFIESTNKAEGVKRIQTAYENYCKCEKAIVNAQDIIAKKQRRIEELHAEMEALRKNYNLDVYINARENKPCQN